VKKSSVLTNKEIAKQINFLGKLMELHGENSFKTRAYTNAYLAIRKWPQPITDMETYAINNIAGIGKTISIKIRELLDTGEIQTMEQYKDKTPIGIQEILTIKGLGPKKVKVIWETLSIESIGELLYAINENRLVDVKGFGAKTQENLKNQLNYHVDSRGKLHYANALILVNEFLKKVKEALGEIQVVYVGEVARKSNIIGQIDILTTADKMAFNQFLEKEESTILTDTNWFLHALPLNIHHCATDEYTFEVERLSSDEAFWQALKPQPKQGIYADKMSVFTDNNLPYYIPEFREKENIPNLSAYGIHEDIISEEQIRGCIHNHSTYSDGVNTLEEMLEACAEKGYEYLVMTDHSKSAFYANGLQEERLLQQLDAIRDLDQEYDEISFFSGIESDILSDGSLDYSDEILGYLDIVVASIHSNLKMGEAKATKRLITAIENPYTSILGHPTGRLLLSREGYPVDYEKIINACAANNVAIELNANPNRLDMDWRWIRQATDKGVLISINPDAHSIKGISDMSYGVASARKGNLLNHQCLNTMDIEEFQEWMTEQHEKRG